MEPRPFNHHDDQADWAALTLELLEDGVHPDRAGALAAEQLASCNAFAADWDRQADAAKRRRWLLSIVIVCLALLVVAIALLI